MRRVLPYALFAVLVCVFLWRPIFTGRALLPGDYLAQVSLFNTAESQKSIPNTQWNPLQWDAISQFYPWRVFYARSMRAGHIPLWNPHQFSGTPFLANGQSACLYPLNFVFVIFNTITAFTIFAALHLFLAQVFMYWMMREFGAKKFGAIVAAIVFAFSAFMVLWLELPTFVSVAVWLPLAIMLAQKSVDRHSMFYGMLCGCALAMALLAGHFQIAFYAIMATCLFWLWKIIETLCAKSTRRSLHKVILPFVGCIFIAALISAPQVLPSFEFAKISHRASVPTEDGYEWFVNNSLPAYRFVTAFTPQFFGDPSRGNYCLLGRVGESTHVASAADYIEYGMYAGVLPLMLAIIALVAIKSRKYIGFFALLVIFALLIATGTPINRLFYFGIPGFSSLGGPNRILFLYLFGIAALAGFGADWIYLRWGDEVVWREKRSRVVVPAVLGAFVVVWICEAVCASAASSLLHNFIKCEVLSAAKSSTGILLALAATWGVIMLSFLRADLGKKVFPMLAIAVVAADLFAFGINYNPTCERSKVYPDTKLIAELRRLTKNGERIAPINSNWSLFETPHAILPPNAAMVYGLYDVQGYDSLFTRAYKNRLAKIEGIDPSPPENGNMALVRRYTPQLNQLADYVISCQPINDSSLHHVSKIDGVNIYKLSLPHSRPQSIAYKNHAFQFGLFLMVTGIFFLLIAIIGRIYLQRHANESR